jgi:hypothetical protein
MHNSVSSSDSFASINPELRNLHSTDIWWTIFMFVYI